MGAQCSDVTKGEGSSSKIGSQSSFSSRDTASAPCVAAIPSRLLGGSEANLPSTTGSVLGGACLGAVQDHIFKYLHDLAEEERQELQEQFDDLFADTKKWSGAFRSARTWLEELAELRWQPPRTLNWETACSTRRTDRSSRTSRLNPQSLHGATVTQVGDVSDQLMSEWRSGGFIMLSQNKVGVVVLPSNELCHLPEGTADIGLLSGKSYFQVLSERLLRLQRLVDIAAHAERESMREMELSLQSPDNGFPVHTNSDATDQSIKYRHTPSEIPLYVVVQPEHTYAVQGFFRTHRYFGLLEGQVLFIPLAEVPVLDFEGKAMLAEKGRILTAGGGDGMVFQAMLEGGGVADAKCRGLDHLFFVRAGDLLVKVADPEFLGFAEALRADVVLKLAEKLEPDEDLDILVQQNGSFDKSDQVSPGPAVRVLQHSEVPQEMRGQRHQNSSQLLYHHGDRKQVVFKLSAFCTACEREEVPYRMRASAQGYIDWRGSGDWCKPPDNQQINAVHFETFMSDAFRELPIVAGYLVQREDPSRPETMQMLDPAGFSSSGKAGLSRLHQKWLLRHVMLQDVGVESEESACLCEVSPLVSYAGEGLEDLLPWDTLCFPLLIRAKCEPEPRPDAVGRPINCLVVDVPGYGLGALPADEVDLVDHTDLLREAVLRDMTESHPATGSVDEQYLSFGDSRRSAREVTLRNSSRDERASGEPGDCADL